MHLNDSSSIVFPLNNNSIPKSKFRKILVENITIIAHEIDKLPLQITEALHIKTKKINSDNGFEMHFSGFLFFLSRIPMVIYLRW